MFDQHSFCENFHVDMLFKGFNDFLCKRLRSFKSLNDVIGIYLGEGCPHEGPGV